MGLDAVVYKHRSKLPADAEVAGLLFDEPTGEWYSPTGRLPEPFRRAGVRAVHKRLGNIALIALLRHEARSLLPNESIIVSKILYGGTHSGDCIALVKTPSLKREIVVLTKRDSDLSPDLRQLRNDLEELVAAAEENRNPIVFA
jgi:hypothetical protein